MAAFNIEQAVAELAILGIERSDALACLNACNNDLVRAADYFYGGGDLQKAREDYNWDASLFDADRDGNPSTQIGHSYDNNLQSEFQIQAPDVHVGSGYEGTKSRPPSRVSNRAGGSAGYQGSEIVFLPPWPGPEDSWMETTDSDRDLARALAASMEGSGAHTGDYGAQETGITGTRTSPATSYLQPANPNREYNPQNWALTTTHEIFLDPGPSERKRKPGDPAFLRPANSGSNIAALLTILHGIPAARESMLASDCLDRDYGHDDQWWNGQQIRILRVTNTGDEETDEPEITEEVIEVQRLMAFLDGTMRAYGSVESLAMNPCYQEHNQTSTLATFFRSWIRAIQKATLEPAEGKYSCTFFSEATQCIRGATDEALMNREAFQIMELVAPTIGETTLYDMLDSIVFPPDDETDVFVKFAPVICAQIKPSDNGIFNSCPIAIPTVLYPDRYTQAWTEPMWEVRRKIEEQRNIIGEIELQEDKLKGMQVNEGTYHELQSVPQPRELLSILAEHYATEGNRGASAGIANGVQSESSAVLAMLEDVIRQLDVKLEALAKKKEEAQETLVKLRSSLTSPKELDPSLPPLTRYTLRGVSPESSTTFTLLRSSDLEEGQNSGSSTGPSGEQWWCISWAPRAPTTGWDTTPTLNYKVEKVTEEKVMDAIKTTGEGAILLVYANDEALNFGEGIDTSLPGPLQTFVDRDNAAFKAELLPNSPGRKRHNDWLDAEDEGASSSPGAGFSPKKISSSRSSATLGNATPEVSRKNSLSGNEIEMMEGIGSGNSQPTTTGGDNAIGKKIDLPQPGGGEMQERGGISPVAMAFHLDSKDRERDLDQDMKDVDSEHIEFADFVGKV